MKLINKLTVLITARLRKLKYKCTERITILIKPQVNVFCIPDQYLTFCFVQAI